MRRKPSVESMKKEDPWYIISTDPAGPQVLHLYAVRGWVDQMFRDVKGQGVHRDQTRLEDPQRLDRLMLVLARIYGWLLDLGIWVDRLGLRRRVDRAKQPKLQPRMQPVHDRVALAQAHAAFRGHP